jgi:hypothetical protein
MADPSKPSADAGGTPKIVVDSDWKSQARAEKDRLEQQAKAREAEKKAAAPAGAASGAPGVGPGGGGDPEALPEADFMTLLGTMVTQALMYMGAFPDPQTGRAIVSLEHAKFHIDLLGVLETKTKGNLSAEESTELSGTLNELRMRFVEISKAVATALERQAAQRAAGGAGAMGMGGLGGGGGGAGGRPGGLPDLRLGQ